MKSFFSRIFGRRPLAELKELTPGEPLKVSAEKRAKLPRLESVAAGEENERCIGVAACHHCGAHLELVCPNGHGSADEVLRDLTAPKRPVASTKQESRKEEPESLICSVSGCNSPRMAWKGRGRKPTRCEVHLRRHPEQQRKLA